MTYKIEKAKATAERVMARRKEPFTEAHGRLFDAIFAETATYRKD